MDHLHKALGDRTFLGQGVDDGVDDHFIVLREIVPFRSADSDHSALDEVAPTYGRIPIDLLFPTTARRISMSSDLRIWCWVQKVRMI